FIRMRLDQIVRLAGCPPHDSISQRPGRPNRVEVAGHFVAAEMTLETMALECVPEHGQPLVLHRLGKALVVAGTKDVANRYRCESELRKLLTGLPARDVALVGLAEDRIEPYDLNLVVLERVYQSGEHDSRPRPLPELRDTLVVDRGNRDDAGGGTRGDGVNSEVVGGQIHPLESEVEAFVEGEPETQQHDSEQKGSPREFERHIRADRTLSSAIRAYPVAASPAIRFSGRRERSPARCWRESSRLFEPAQLLVHAELPILVRVAVAGLRAEAELPRPIVEAQIGATLALAFGQEAAEVHGAADAAKDHELFSREQDCLDIDFTAGDAILKIMDRTERSIERVLTVQKYPAREIAFDHAGVTVRDVVSARDIKMCAREQAEIDPSLEAAEVQAWEAAGVGIKRTLEAVADPQLVAGRAAENPDVRRDALLGLRPLLQDTVLVAD